MLPKQAGFYWATWRVFEDGAGHGPALLPDSGWEVVLVYANGDDPSDDGFFRVMLLGIEATQPVDHFDWGAGPLLPPA